MDAAQATLGVVIMLVVLALAFDFMNGFHDAANSIATVVSTGVLRPTQAVVFAAFFNVVAIFIFHLSVAATVGKGIVEPGVVDTHIIFGALVKPALQTMQDLTAREIAILAPLVVITIALGVYPKPVFQVTTPAVAKLISDNKTALAYDHGIVARVAANGKAGQ